MQRRQQWKTSSIALTPRTPYWERLRYELWKGSGSIFDLREPNGRQLDVASTFASKSGRTRRIISACFRLLVFLGVVVHVWHAWLVVFPEQSRWVYWAYLTRWVLFLTWLYFGLASIVSFWPQEFLQQPSTTDQMDPPVPHVLVRTMWMIFNGILPLHFIVTICYWIAIGSGDGTAFHEAVIDHGGLFLLTCLDGMVFHKIPVRIRQAGMIYTIYGMYTFFYLIYDIKGDIGNGDNPWEEEGDTTPLYESVNFTTSKRLGYFAFVAAPFTLIPCVYWLCWTLSLYSGSCRFDGSARKLVNLNASGNSPALAILCDEGGMAEGSSSHEDMELSSNPYY